MDKSGGPSIEPRKLCESGISNGIGAERPHAQLDEAKTCEQLEIV